MIDDAATLDERLAASVTVEAVPSEEAVSALRPWIQSFAAGDQDAFLERLAWDDLDLDRALAAVHGPFDLRAEPDWIRWLDRFLAEARGLAAGPLPRDPAIAFLELWLPVSRAARAELRDRAGSALAAFTPAAMANLEERLLHEAATLGELAALEHFRARHPAPAQSETPSRNVYDAHVRRLLAGEMRGFLGEYPVLARLLATLAETWVASVAELAQRLERDRDTLVVHFGAANGLGQVASVDAALGDRHHEGRRVMGLGFETGLRLIYKPRDIGVEAAFASLLEWARGQGIEVPPPLRALARDGYGWVGFVEPGAFTSLAEVHRYFRRAGALLCLVDLLRGRDLHRENVIAALEGPQLVDTEMLLQPRDAGASAPSDGPVAPGLALQESCLGSGLLSLMQADGQGGVLDIGGLRGRGAGRSPIARRVWRALGTDAIHFVREERFETAETNQVRLNGVVHRAEDHAEALLGGFEQAYRGLLARRDALVADAGPLAAFAGIPVRVLLRTSTQYGALQFVLASPRYQRSGLARSFAIDSLNRGFVGETTRPRLWPLVKDERRALEQLDIPRFTVLSDATALRADSAAAIEGWFAQPGWAAVQARTRGLSEDDLASQLEYLEAALESGVDSRFSTPPPERLTGPEPASLLEAAVWIGRELVARAVPSQTGLRWRTPPYAGSRLGLGPLRLYDGAGGPALFLAALASAGSSGAWNEAARAALTDLLHRTRTAEDDAAEPIGGAAGLGSIAYAAGLAAALIGAEDLLGEAVALAARITPERIAADQRFDVVAGAAGAALALLALYRLRREEWLVERAVLCARRLRDAAVPIGGDTLAWPATDGRLLAGLGHGASGIALALARTGAASGERRFIETARAGFAFEHHLYSPAERNWRVAPGGTGFARPSTMTAWCHGAPGVGLARALAAAVLDEGELHEQIELAMQTTAGGLTRGSDHLCCGSLGRGDALLTAGRALGRPEWIEAAMAGATHVTARACRQRRFSLPSSEFECRPFHPGFFRGLSGVGYQLLRAAAPARVPTVLGFGTPERDGDLP